MKPPDIFERKHAPQATPAASSRPHVPRCSSRHTADSAASARGTGGRGLPGGGLARAIRLALAEVKGISEAEVLRVVSARPYQSLTDFWHRARASRPVVERLVLAGADVIFLANHGIIVTGPTMADAFDDLEHGPHRGRGGDEVDAARCGSHRAR